MKLGFVPAFPTDGLGFSFPGSAKSVSTCLQVFHFKNFVGLLSSPIFLVIINLCLKGNSFILFLVRFGRNEW